MAKSLSGKSHKGRQHVNHAKKYLRQWMKTSKNKAKAWAKHLRNHPNDKDAQKNIGVAKEKVRKL
jgi:hypothetical protein